MVRRQRGQDDGSRRRMVRRQREPGVGSRRWMVRRRPGHSDGSRRRMVRRQREPSVGSRRWIVRRQRGQGDGSRRWMVRRQDGKELGRRSSFWPGEKCGPRLMNCAARAARAELHLKGAELDVKGLANRICPFATLETCVDHRTGIDEEGTCCFPTGRTRKADGKGDRLAALAIKVEQLDQGDVGELTAAWRRLHSGCRALLFRRFPTDKVYETGRPSTQGDIPARGWSRRPPPAPREGPCARRAFGCAHGSSGTPWSF